MEGLGKSKAKEENPEKKFKRGKLGHNPGDNGFMS